MNEKKVGNIPTDSFVHSATYPLIIAIFQIFLSVLLLVDLLYNIRYSMLYVSASI